LTSEKSKDVVPMKKGGREYGEAVHTRRKRMLLVSTHRNANANTTDYQLSDFPQKPKGPFGSASSIQG
jgi:hypothetical protein